MIDYATLYIPVGLAIGLGAAAPVGPVNLLVIQQALVGRRRAALVIGAGAACADLLFALVAAFGLGAVGIAIDRHDTALRIVGGLVLMGFAGFVWRSAPHLASEAPPMHRSRLLAMGLTMALTNPANLLFFLTSFSAIGIADLGHDTAAHRGNSILVALSVGAGAMLWWLFVTTLATRLKGRLSDAALARLNHATALVLGLFGLAALTAGVLAGAMRT